METEALFDAAFSEHQTGKLERAHLLYQQVIKRNPLHADALHLAGVAVYQLGHGNAAEELIGRAIAIKPSPEYLGNLGLVRMSLGKIKSAISAYRGAIELRQNFAEGHNNLGNALRQSGRLDEAIASYHKAISCRADFSEAYNNLGMALCDCGDNEQAIAAFSQAIALRPNAAEARNNLGNCHHRNGDLDKAIACWREALSHRPHYAEAHNNLGNAFMQRGELDDAIASFQKALEIQPELAEAQNNLGVTYFGQKRYLHAIAAYRQALTIRPDYVAAHFNLAIALHATDESAAAIESCRRAIALRPDWAEARNNLGIWLGETGQGDLAIEAFDAALNANPNYPEAHSNRGNALRQLGRMNESIEAYHRAIALRPDSAEAHNNLGNSLKQLGRVEEAIEAFQAAQALDPAMAEAHNNLANVLKDQARLDEALGCYDRAIELRPDDPAALSNRIYTLHFHENTPPEAILAEHLRWNDRHAEPIRNKIEPLANDPSVNRRLRIGYIAPDFREHCQSLFTVPLFSNHDHERFEIVCFSDVVQPDAVTERLRQHADVWRNIVGMSDDRVAEMIRRERIDILVDLTVHMAFNRMRVFAMKPAPVQATWLGYPGTTGVHAIDYRLSDPYLDPPENDGFYSEKTLRLPDSYWCYDPMTSGPKVNAPPMKRNGCITFGCLNNFCKVNDSTLELWAAVMQAVPNSRLLLLAPQGSARLRVLEVLGRAGVSPIRVDFTARLHRGTYLKLYHQIDIGLDTFPYNGHTTTLDAFWMGVPVVTKLGRAAVGRAGFSQLSNLGLLDLCGNSDADFVNIATRLCGDVDRLRTLRASLRGMLESSPLMNAPRFARGMEAAYRQMWETWSARASRRFTIVPADPIRRKNRAALQMAS